MKLIRWLSPLFLLLSGICFAQTTYTQTTHTCTIDVCTDAQFTPSATLSYSILIQYCGGSFYNGTVTWNGNTYTDYSGKMTWLGYQGNYPFGTWQVQGTFDNGAYTVTEIFNHTFRGCSGGRNSAGFVVGP